LKRLLLLLLATLTTAARAEVGSIKVKPASWKDYFFPEAYDLNGS
jgi:hypothetical protein